MLPKNNWKYLKQKVSAWKHAFGCMRKMKLTVSFITAPEEKKGMFHSMESIPKLLTNTLPS